jgi:hypothetical protein
MAGYTSGKYFALYIISKDDHPSYGSSVSENTLKRLNPGLKILEKWMNYIRKLKPHRKI